VVGGNQLMSVAEDDTGGSDTNAVRSELPEALLEESREELGRADGKASILFAASGVVVSVLLAGAIARKWDPTELGWFQLLWWPVTLHNTATQKNCMRRSKKEGPALPVSIARLTSYS
jgi:hypothetical protein